VTYFLEINEIDNRPMIEKEILQYRRGSKGQPWRFLDFSRGKGQAVINEPAKVTAQKELKREEHELKSPDILALKGLAQFEKFPASKALGELLENWHVSDFHIQQARPERESGYAEHLSKEGENLALVTEFLYTRHPAIFQKIIAKLKQRVPGISEVDAKITEEGRVLLRFKDGEFKDPFLARHVSDGTIKMFAYLVLLHDPKPHPLPAIITRISRRI
jgi:predicted ATPase